jgi:hypothetical protein
MMNDKETSMTELEQMEAAGTNELWHNPLDPGKGIIAGLSRIRWSSAAGILTGTVKSVDYAKNAAGDMIPWMNIRIEDSDRYAPGYIVRLALTRTNLAPLKAEVLN